MVTLDPQTIDTQSEPRAKLGYEEFLVWAAGRYAEWVNNEGILYMTASALHQRVVIFLIRLIQQFADLHELGEVFTAPMQVRLAKSGREPDVFFVSKQNLVHVMEKNYEGAPDLAIEIISDESVGRDRGEKFDEYEEAGVAEYWIIDPRPRRQRADFYIMGKDGKYIPVPLDEAGVFYSKVLPGFWLKASWFWADPLPKLMPTLKEITG